MFQLNRRPASISSSRTLPARRNSLLSVGGAAEEQLEERCMLATYYVATNGNNANNGKSLSKPFKTIQKAADVAKAGDNVQIRGGTYREQVSIRRSGALGKAITFIGYKNERVVISAVDKVKSKPVIVGGNVSRYNLQSTIGNSVKDGTKNGNILKNRQGLSVFNKGVVLQEGRRRNSTDQLNADTWATAESGDKTKLVDKQGNFTKDLVGSYVFVRPNKFNLEKVRIKSVPNSTTLVFDRPIIRNVIRPNSPYMLLDNRKFVDSAGEWYFNEEENNLYVFGKPGSGISVKVRKEGFVTNNHNHLRFIRLNFLGGDIELGTSSNITIDRIDAYATDRISGAFITGAGSGSVQALKFTGNNNKVSNSTFRHMWQAGIRLAGSGNRVYNNKFLNSGINGGGAGGVALGGSRNLVSYNTFVNIGRSAIFGGAGSRNVIEHNYFEKAARITKDTGAIYYWNKDLQGLTIRRNFFTGMRGATTGAIYMDNQVKNVVIHNNIVTNSDFGIITNRPSTNVRVFNNTLAASVKNSLFAGAGGAAAGPATRGKHWNNIYVRLSPSLTLAPGGTSVSNNVRITNDSIFVNPGKRDFRLKAGSSPINKGRVIAGVTDGFNGSAPDAGAIEFGKPMFVFGANFSKSPTANQVVYRWRKLP